MIHDLTWDSLNLTFLSKRLRMVSATLVLPLYGHRRDPIGYGKAQEQFDDRLNEVLAEMSEDDLLMITADHGNDPIHVGTDHTREYVPLLLYSKSFTEQSELPVSKTFSDIGVTIADNFNVKMPQFGQSLLQELK